LKKAFLKEIENRENKEGVFRGMAFFLLIRKKENERGGSYGR
jgi:hypothetical protein